MSTVTRPITFQEFEKLPDAPGKRELLDGELFEMPPARREHMRLVKRFYRFLLTVVDEQRVWFESGYRIREGWLQPDVSVDWPEDRVVDGYPVSGPMVAIEVASPSNTAPEMDRKTLAYLDGGSAEVWIVYPSSRSVVVHVRGERIATRYTDSYECKLLGATIPVADLLK